MRISDWSSDVCSSDLIGISRFEATVLPSNRRMVRVFQQAGYGASSAYADGVIEVTFDIEPSEEAARAMAERARLAERRSEERRAGHKGGSTCSTRGSPDP